MKNKLPLYVFALLAAFIFNSCKKEYETIQTVDEAKIQSYLKANNLTMTKDPSGFYYQVLDPGTGTAIANTDSVFFDFNYKSLSGTTYYQSATTANVGEYLGYTASPVQIRMGTALEYYPGTAFRTALSQVNRGGKVRIIIPSYLAFGKNGTDNFPAIPSNEVLVAEVSLYKEASQQEIDDNKIKAYMLTNGITAVKLPTRVYQVLTSSGTGTEVTKPSSTIEVKYVGRLLDGTVFEQTGDDTYTTTLGTFIKGWSKNLLGYTAGAKIRLIIPSDLAYGNVGQAKIPANSVLDFDIEIVKVTN